jgi:hypothetical protein
MNSSAEPWVPGQRTVYYPEGALMQHSSGTWYVRENGSWRLMTEAEIAAMEAKQ